VPKVDRVLFLSDVAFIPYPTLEEKKCIIEYTSNVARACGVENPKAAVVCCTETVNPKMPITVEADELSKMQDNGEIKDCIVEGPLSLDIALFPAAAEEKGAMDRKVAGDADILIFPDLHAGNLVYKCMTQVVENMKNGCILTGTKAPVVLTSRADTFETKVNSIALAAIVAHELKK
jgi:phosphate butyryltransferase